MRVRKSLALTIAAFAALDALLVGAVAVPAVRAINQGASAIADGHRKLQDQYALQQFMRTASATLGADKARASALAASSVREGQELDFIAALEQAADAAGVTLRKSLETANQKEVSPWENRVPLKLDADGSYPQLLRFMNAVERLPYLIVPQTAAIASPGHLTMTAFVYWTSKDAPDFVRGDAQVPDAAQTPR